MLENCSQIRLGQDSQLSGRQHKRRQNQKTGARELKKENKTQQGDGRTREGMCSQHHFWREAHATSYSGCLWGAAQGTRLCVAHPSPALACGGRPPPRTPIPRPASAPLRWPPLCSRCLLNPKWKAALAPGGSSAGRVWALRWTVLERPSVPISGVSVGSGPGDTAVALAAPLCMTAPS